MKPYEKLAFLYQKHWGKFSLGYLDLLKHVFKKFKFHPSTILDIACGTGDLIFKLHENGFQVTGSDISPEMIKVAKTRNPLLKLAVKDMCKLQINKTFDLIICAFDSLNYLTTEKQIDSAFSKAYKHLNKDGFFVFDINTPNLYKAKHHGIIDRIKFRQILEYDSVKKLAYTTFEFSNKDREKHIQKAYTKNEITKKLNSHNFKIVDIYENLKFNKANNKSEKIFFVTKKAVT